MANYNQNTKIKGALRQIARYMPNREIALERARDWQNHGVRGGAMYFCAKHKQKKSFLRKDIQVDHIDPVEPIDRKVTDWNEHIKRLFCEVSNLQVLCKPCHLIKSIEENANRTY